MKEDKIEYYHNGKLKHKIGFYDNDGKRYECFRDENGRYHNINAPSYQEWYDNGRKRYESYHIKNQRHNISNPTDIYFHENGKIEDKFYHINGGYYFNKLNWNNKIKNIIEYYPNGELKHKIVFHQ
jgi:antitoxin component YwqK of YwqJK toxin-antitoxin module